MVKPDSGYSIIELMIVMVLLMAFILLGMPMLSGWSSTSNVSQTSALLKQAMTMTKSLALQNANGKTDTAPAALLVATATKLCVYQTIPLNLNCSATPLWSSAITASLTINGASALASQCIALNNRAIAVSATVGSTVCGTSLNFTVSQGDVNVSGTLN